MKDKRFLEEELNVIDEEIKKVSKKYDRKELLSLLGTVFFTTLGTFTVFTIPLLGAALFGGAIASFESKLSNKKRMENELGRLTREKKHISKVLTTGLNTSKELTQKRIRKVNSLIAENNKKTKKYKRWKKANDVALAGVGISLAVATFIPVIGLAAAAVTTGAKLIASNRLNRSHEELQINKNRVNNLITDINTIKLAESSARKRSKQSSPVKQQAPRKTAEKTSQNAQSVQAYIDKLSQAKQQVSPAKVKQKTKY